MDFTLRKDYRLIAFDLDDTLAPSKSPLPDRMAAALRRLLDLVDVCVISGGQFGQFSSQLLDNLGASAEQLGRLHLMPTCGTRYMRCIDGQWVEIYARDLTAHERRKVMEVLESQARRLGLWRESTKPTESASFHPRRESPSPTCFSSATASTREGTTIPCCAWELTCIRWAAGRTPPGLSKNTRRRIRQARRTGRVKRSCGAARI
mgnify:CR=1 FL=1